MRGRVLITGAAGALGRSVVERFIEAGERVLAVDASEGALAQLTELGKTQPEVKELVEFIGTSTRSLVR